MLVLRLRVPTPARALGILTWAGLRGGVSIALALILPPSAYRDLLLAICQGPTRVPPRPSVPTHCQCRNFEALPESESG